ncbi:hypothetical protein T07_9881 [Trichinella nelsoni]|uniref:Uncharacterized protein n=1 Tax=Trichinella nelsoni TaxID=6336 RepID=A0A0V0RWI7_9BILA|nr:hypothetical protein T07_9881 [Trichinella nelsoni]
MTSQRHGLTLSSIKPVYVSIHFKQIVNGKEHIQYGQHILLNTPNISSVYRYILICTPCLHTQGTYRRNSLSQEGLVQLTTAVNSPWSTRCVVNSP